MPYPQRLIPAAKDKYQSDIKEIFAKCQINIPLLTAINQIPKYAKFLKELCTVKRNLHVKKRAFMTEQVSAVLNHNIPQKLSDPGAPIISCTIGTRKLGMLSWI